jgi:AAA domain
MLGESALKMPRIQKLVMPTANGAPHIEMANDPLADAMPVGAMRYKFYNVTLYGPSGSGKTTLAALFDKPSLLVSYEPGENGGSQSVRKVPGLTFKRCHTKAEAVAVAQRLAADPRSAWHWRDGKWLCHVKDADGRDVFLEQHQLNPLCRPVADGLPYATHIQDSATSLQDVILKGLMNLDEVPVQLGWGTVPEGVYRERSEQAKEVLRKFRDLPANTVMLAKEKDHNKQEGDRQRMVPGMRDAQKGFWTADVGRGTAEWMQDASDYIVRLYPAPEVKTIPGQPIVMGDGSAVAGDPQLIETGRIVRRLRCTLSDTYAARFRSPEPDCVPEYIQGLPQQIYDDFVRVANGDRAVNGYYGRAQ